jgi:thioredoxin 1
VSEPIHVNDKDFEQFVLKAATPVLVDFWAPWCGPCRMVGPFLDRIAQEYAGRLLVTKVNIDDNEEWADRYDVQTIPTLLIMSDGKILHQHIGAVSYPALKKMVDHWLENGQAVQTSAER